LFQDIIITTKSFSSYARRTIVVDRRPWVSGRLLRMGRMGMVVVLLVAVMMIYQEQK